MLEIPADWTWLWWALPLLILALAALWLWRRRRRLAQGARPAPSPAPPAPHLRARRLLEEALELLHDPDRFCVLVSDAVRGYLEERFALRAPERTTEEFLEELSRSPQLEEEHKGLLGGFLAECDLVKFARLPREAHHLTSLHQSALRLVDETEPGPEERIPSP